MALLLNDARRSRVAAMELDPAKCERLAAELPFLASDRASGITGTIVHSNGGTPSPNSPDPP